MSEGAVADRQEATTLAEGLRSARQSRGLSQRELAARVNLSPSMISQIEAGQSQPSVTTLYAIVTELDISMDELFDHTPGAGGDGELPPLPAPDRPEAPRSGTGQMTAKQPTLVPLAERPRLRLETGVTWERLASPDPEAVDIMEVVYDVDGTSSRDGTLTRHNSVEVVVLLAGRLDVQVAFDVHHLVPGDSIAFDSTIPHRLSNPGTEPARAISIVLAH